MRSELSDSLMPSGDRTQESEVLSGFNKRTVRKGAGSAAKETTPFYPRSPYGVAKIYGYWIVVNYREAYDIFACNGILFNHESPRRGETFVTRKITRAVARIKHGLQNSIHIGNLDAKRDWGYAPEYCEGMWRILQHKKAEDFVLATGVTRSVREFIELSFKEIGTEIAWKGKGVNEVGKDKKTGKVLVEIDPTYFRPTEVDLLIGDPSKAKKLLGWKPKTKLEELVRIMVKADCDMVQKKGY